MSFLCVQRVRNLRNNYTILMVLAFLAFFPVYMFRVKNRVDSEPNAVMAAFLWRSMKLDMPEIIVNTRCIF